MPRYFMEVCYRGTHYAGFQVQKNANTVQAEIEKALHIYFRKSILLTGSSRTDAGVHAVQNYFHFDFDAASVAACTKAAYHLNSILPADIVVKNIIQVVDEAHCRFDARLRMYEYSLYRFKDPFLADRSYYYPYQLNIELLNEAAAILKTFTDFSAFSKKNTQVKHYECNLSTSEWVLRENMIVYRVSGNRFLRGMVKGLTGTMLRIATGKLKIHDFIEIIESKDAARVDFSVPAHGLTLLSVDFAQKVWKDFS